jgi:hypothetical protein
MPDYTIHIHQGPDMSSDIVSLPDVDAARREAAAVFADLARDIASNLSQHPAWRIEVMEPAGEIVFKLGLLAESLPKTPKADETKHASTFYPRGFHGFPSPAFAWVVSCDPMNKWRCEMVSNGREIYHSENGDRWLLCREGDHTFVLHSANKSSGGKLTPIELGDFLGRGKTGPEHQALLRLIGTLVDNE